MAEDKVYYCSNCGGIMVFDVKTQSLKCPNCDTQKEIENDDSQIVEHDFNRRVEKKLTVSEKKSSTMQCKGCGAIVEVSADCTATECMYCGTKYVLAEKQQEAIIPDGVIPFKIDKNKSKEIFTNWINKRWLAPSSLKNLYEHDKMQGIYIPYWTFDADGSADYRAEGGNRRTIREEDSQGNVHEKTVVDWYPTSGFVKEMFDDVLVKASKSLKPSLLKGIEPFNTRTNLSSYAPEYMSGYSAECYTVPIDEAHSEAINIMRNALQGAARKDVLRHYDEVRNVSIRAKFKDETYKHVMLPVYATSFNYEGKNYPVLINGETGKISGNYPKSKLKIAIIIAIIVAIIVGMFMMKNADAATLGQQDAMAVENQNAVMYEMDQYSEVYTVDYDCTDGNDVIDIDEYSIENL